MINDEVNQRADFDCLEQETNSRLILHVARFKTFLLLSNNSDVVTYLSAYFDQFKTKNVENIQVKYGLKERQQHIPIHRLAGILESHKSRALLKTHDLTGCDFISKVGSKLSSINAEAENFL